MALLQGRDREFESLAPMVSASEMRGLAGWALGLLQRGSRERGTRQKQLRLLETLSLGGKKQLMLVECAGETFLIGGGVESVQTMVRLQDQSQMISAAKSVEEPCR